MVRCKKKYEKKKKRGKKFSGGLTKKNSKKLFNEIIFSPETDIKNKTKENVIEKKKVDSFLFSPNIIGKADKIITKEEKINIKVINNGSDIQNSSSKIIKYIKPENTSKNNYKPKGLENFNSNCYMNSLLQCFFYLKNFRNYFLTNDFKKDQLMCQAMKDVMKGLNIIDGKSFYSARKIKNEIKKNSIFKDGEGSDVTDLLDYIFDNIILEFEEDNSSTHTVEYQTKTHDKIFMYRELYKEINFDIIINRLFVGFYEKEFKCENGHLKYSFQSEYRIVFSLEEIFSYYKTKEYLTLYDCFDHYRNVQTINEIEKEEEEDKKSDESNSCDNSFIHTRNEESIKNSVEDYESSKKEVQNENGNENFDECQKCEKKYQLVEKMYRTPEYLIIILDRGYKKKCDKKVIFDEEIDLNDYLEDETYEYQTKYILTGVCIHHGKSGNFGHYTSICLCDDNKYYHLNDSSSRPLRYKEELYEGSPYILFYSRKDLTKKQKITKAYFYHLRSKIFHIIERIEKIKDISVVKKHEYYLLKYIITEKTKNSEKETIIQIDFSEFNHKSKEPKLILNKAFKEKKKLETSENKIIFWEDDLSDEENKEKFDKYIESYFEEFKIRDSIKKKFYFCWPF